MSTPYETVSLSERFALKTRVIVSLCANIVHFMSRRTLIVRTKNDLATTDTSYSDIWSEQVIDLVQTRGADVAAAANLDLVPAVTQLTRYVHDTCRGLPDLIYDSRPCRSAAPTGPTCSEMLREFSESGLITDQWVSGT